MQLLLLHKVSYCVLCHSKQLTANDPQGSENGPSIDYAMYIQWCSLWYYIDSLKWGSFQFEVCTKNCKCAITTTYHSSIPYLLIQCLAVVILVLPQMVNAQSLDSVQPTTLAAATFMFSCPNLDSFAAVLHKGLHCANKELLMAQCIVKILCCSQSCTIAMM